MKKFQKLATNESNQIKGGKKDNNTFCEWYVGFADATGTPINEDTMEVAMYLDSISSDKKIK